MNLFRTQKSLPSPKSVSQVLVSHQHRLISLQVGLQEAYKTGVMKSAQYERRAEKLRNALAKLRSIKRWHDAQEVELTDESNLGLPDLNQCTPDEIHICQDFLSQRSRLLSRLVADAEKLNGWIEKASHGLTFRFWYVFQLSWLKDRITKVEHHTAALKFHSDELNEYSNKVANLFEPLQQSRSDRLRTNVAAMMELFYRLDKIATRISGLKAQQTQAEEEVFAAREWLAQERILLDRPIHFEPPPPPKATVEACESHSILTPQNFGNTKRRLTLVKKFVAEHVKSKEPPEHTNSQPRNVVTINLDLPSRGVAFSAKKRRIRRIRATGVR